jgi:trimeric autotransporter adhesin
LDAIIDKPAKIPRHFASMKTSIRSLAISTLVIVGLAFLPEAQAVVPPPDGGYPGDNTAEGDGALLNLTSGVWNTALGRQALRNDTTGGANTATGFQALLNNTTGDRNTACGSQSLNRNRVGSDNAAIGVGALYFNQSTNNTAIGNYALYGNTQGTANTATGYGALSHNGGGDANTATGYQALNSNTFQAGANTATGYQALYNNTSASGNTATGYQALFSNTTGRFNTADGYQALYRNTTGFTNTAIGEFALRNNTTGYYNTAVGYEARFESTTGNFNTAIGAATLSNNTGSDNIALGDGAGQNLTTGDGNIDIGSAGEANDSYTIRIGQFHYQTAAFIAGIYEGTTGSTMTRPVIVDENGQLGTVASSQRFKTEIEPMGESSEAILALKPVTFHYKHDSQGRPQFGLIAEEVAKVNPALVLPDTEGKPYTVRYEAVNAMLLNEFLKEHRKVEKLEAMITTLATTVKEQAEQIQRVSGQLEMAKLAGKVAKNEQ